VTKHEIRLELLKVALSIADPPLSAEGAIKAAKEMEDYVIGPKERDIPDSEQR
jgi:hypothetical protein